MPARKKKKKITPAAFGLLLLVSVGAVIGFMAYGPRLVSFFKRQKFHSPAPVYKAFGVKVPAGYEVVGIDVSRYQGHIDWRKVSEMRSGRHRIRFAFAKATEGVSRTDPHYARNRREAAVHGIPFGAYHFFRPAADPVSQADFFCRHYIPRKGELPPMCDVETSGNLSPAELSRRLKIFMDRVEQKTGTRPILYTYHTFYKRHLGSGFSRYPLWVAHYGPGKPHDLNWTFWQFSEKSRISGIRHPVDLNVYRGSAEEFNRLLRR
jgi:lysozyme